MSQSLDLLNNYWTLAGLTPANVSCMSTALLFEAFLKSQVIASEKRLGKKGIWGNSDNGSKLGKSLENLDEVEEQCLGSMMAAILNNMDSTLHNVKDT